MAHPDLPFHTADMVRDLIQEDRAWPRYETFYGELVVTPAPGSPHQWIAGELFAELHQYLARWPAVGVAFMSPADISWGRRDVLVQPDVFVVPVDAFERSVARGWREVLHLRLAVEIVSPGSARRDRFAKRVLYQRQGVETYWVIDPDRGEAEAWTPDAEAPRVMGDRLAWHPPEAGEAFVFDLAAPLARLAALRARADD